MRIFFTFLVRSITYIKVFHYSFTNFKNKDKGFLFDVLYIKLLAHSLMIVGKTFYKKLLKFKILII